MKFSNTPSGLGKNKKNDFLFPFCFFFFFWVCSAVDASHLLIWDTNFFVLAKFDRHASSSKIFVFLIKPTIHLAPVASASALESAEGSDEDNMTDSIKLDTAYPLTNRNCYEFI